MHCAKHKKTGLKYVDQAEAVAKAVVMAMELMMAAEKVPESVLALKTITVAWVGKSGPE